MAVKPHTKHGCENTHKTAQNIHVKSIAHEKAKRFSDRFLAFLQLINHKKLITFGIGG